MKARVLVFAFLALALGITLFPPFVWGEVECRENHSEYGATRGRMIFLGCRTGQFPTKRHAFLFGNEIGWFQPEYWSTNAAGRSVLKSTGSGVNLHRRLLVGELVLEYIVALLFASMLAFVANKGLMRTGRSAYRACKEFVTSHSRSPNASRSTKIAQPKSELASVKAQLANLTWNSDVSERLLLKARRRYPQKTELEIYSHVIEQYEKDQERKCLKAKERSLVEPLSDNGSMPSTSHLRFAGFNVDLEHTSLLMSGRDVFVNPFASLLRSDILIKNKYLSPDSQGKFVSLDICASMAHELTSQMLNDVPNNLALKETLLVALQGISELEPKITASFKKNNDAFLNKLRDDASRISAEYDQRLPNG